MLSVKRRLLHGSSVVAAIVLAYGGGVVTGVVGAQADEAGGAGGGTGVMVEAAREISDNAVRPVPHDELERAAISGMLRALDDPWSRYYSPSEYRDFRTTLTGAASRDGARERLNDQQTARDHSGGRELGDVSVRYLEGTGGIEGVFLIVEPDSFNGGVATQVRHAVMGRSTRHVAGMILDLRGNPGGLLQEAVRTASVFLESGPIVAYERRGEGREVLRANGTADTVTPLVVLVDGGTASAAEVVAGALQDRNRAVLVGSRTYGKATVQQAYRLEDGSALKLTVGHYYTPSGRNISKRGITPDVYVQPEQSPEVARRRAVRVLSGLRAALPAR